MNKSCSKIQFLTVVALLGVFLVICSGCGTSENKQTAMQEKIDQFEEALRYNYASSYLNEAFAFSSVLAEMKEYGQENSLEIGYLKGMIHGIQAEKIYPAYKMAYDISIDKMQEPRITDEMRKSAEVFLDDFWEYIEALDSLSYDVLAQFLEDETFSSLNKQLQETIEQHLTIDISTDNENLQERFKENAEKACELVSQLEEIIKTT